MCACVTNAQINDSLNNILKNLNIETHTKVAPEPTVKVKYYPFVERNKAFSFNIGYNYSYGVEGRYKGVSGMSFALSLYGVYLDFSGNVEGNHAGNMGVDKYSGYKTQALHIGYTFPISDWMRIIPVIGYSTSAIGYYDGSDFTVDENGVSNKFHASDKSVFFDYGVVVNVTIVKWLSLYANIERRNIGMGVGVYLTF